MEKDILEILEFDKIRDRLAELAPSVLSKKRKLPRPWGKPMIFRAF